MARLYLETITITSNDTEQRALTPYDNEETAIRKYHETFAGVGAGPKFISARLHDKYNNALPGYESFWEQSQASE